MDLESIDIELEEEEEEKEQKPKAALESQLSPMKKTDSKKKDLASKYKIPRKKKAPLEVSKEEPDDDDEVPTDKNKSKPSTAVPDKLELRRMKTTKFLEDIDSTNFYWKKIGLIIFIELLSVAVIILRGGKGIDSVVGAEKCNVTGFGIFGGYVVAMASLFALCLCVVITESRLKKKVGWNYHKDEVKINKKLYICGAALSFFVGFISVIIGVGGSSLITPLLLSLGVLPEVISYSSTYLGTLKNLISTLIFIFSGIMPFDFLLILGGLVILAVLLTEWRVSALIKKLGRQSLITMFFFVINLLSEILVIYSIFIGWDGFEAFLEFENYCDIS